MNYYIIKAKKVQPLTAQQSADSAEPDGINLASARSYYTKPLRSTKDVADVKFVSELTGCTVHTVREWITDRKLRAFALPGVYAVPKEYLINFLSSKAYNSIRRKSRKHIETLWIYYFS